MSIKSLIGSTNIWVRMRGKTKGSERLNLQLHQVHLFTALVRVEYRTDYSLSVSQAQVSIPSSPHNRWFNCDYRWKQVSRSSMELELV
jgi:hypothetical protein